MKKSINRILANTSTLSLSNLQFMMGGYTVSTCTCCETTSKNNSDCKDGDTGDSEKSILYAIDYDDDFTQDFDLLDKIEFQQLDRIEFQQNVESGF